MNAVASSASERRCLSRYPTEGGIYSRPGRTAECRNRDDTVLVGTSQGEGRAVRCQKQHARIDRRLPNGPQACDNKVATQEQIAWPISSGGTDVSCLVVRECHVAIDRDRAVGDRGDHVLGG